MSNVPWTGFWEPGMPVSTATPRKHMFRFKRRAGMVLLFGCACGTSAAAALDADGRWVGHNTARLNVRNQLNCDRPPVVFAELEGPVNMHDRAFTRPMSHEEQAWQKGYYQP